VDPAPDDPARVRRNNRRRVIAVTVCFAPLILAAASLAAGWFWPRTSPIGVALAVLAVPVLVLNLTLAFVRPVVYRLRHGSMDGYRHVSGLPLIGNLFAVAGAVVGFGDWRAAGVALFATVCDTGSMTWLAVVIWRDPSFWDE
jgi:hypothetical protein